MVVCKRCGVEKPVGEFHWHRRNESRKLTCKECINAAKRARKEPLKPYVNLRKVEAERHKAEADLFNQVLTRKL